MSGLDSLRPTAARLIKNYGRQVTMTRQSSGTYDPQTGSSPVSPQTLTVNAVVDQYDSMQIASGSVQRGDLRLLVEDIDPPPTVGDTFAVNGATLQAMSVVLFSTGSLNGYSEVQARRA